MRDINVFRLFNCWQQFKKLKVNYKKLSYETKIFILSLLFGLLLIGCNNNDDNNTDCVKNVTAYVTSVNSPTNAGMVNETISIEVKFQVTSSCGGFGKFIETENGNTRIIEVEAKYVGCDCFTVVQIITANYPFIPKETGNYELKFKSSPTDYITVNLTIN